MIKLRLSKLGIPAALALSMLTAAPCAFAADAPTAEDAAIEATLAEEPLVTLNGKAAPVRAEIIDGKLYFSLRDYWANVTWRKPENIRWHGLSQTVSDGFDFLSLKEQQLSAPIIGMVEKLSEPAILKDGTVYVTPAYLDISRGSNRIKHDTDGNQLHLHRLTWVQNGVDLTAEGHISVYPVAMNTEKGLPDFESRLAHEYFSYFDYSDDLFDITKTEDGDKTIFTYVMKEDPSRSMTVTVEDGYVSRIEDNHALDIYRPR